MNMSFLAFLDNLAAMLWERSLLVLPFVAIAFALTKTPWFKGPKVQMTLWSLVFLRLLMPASWAPTSARIIQAPPVLLSDMGVEPALKAVAVSAGMEGPSLKLWILAGWFMLACLLACRWLWQRQDYVRLVKRAQVVACPETLAILKRWCHTFRIKRSVSLVTHDGRTGPFTLGTLKPVVFLPTKILEDGGDCLEAVIAHELAHVAAYDDLKIMGQRAIGTVFFFHPAVHLAGRKLNYYREPARDQDVLAQGLLHYKAYGLGLLDACRRQFIPPQQLAALGSNLAHRVKAMISPQSTPVRPMLVLALGLAVFPFSFSQQEPESAGPPQWQHPLPTGRLTSGFGLRLNPFSGQQAHHRGVDLSAPKGTAIVAPADALVMLATTQPEKPNWGTTLVLQHAGGFQTHYAHLQTLKVSPGDKVKAGQVVATVGDTGRVTAPHLHLEARKDASLVDPATLFPIK